MLAADAGVKWRGPSANGQYSFRWLNRFRADGRNHRVYVVAEGLRIFNSPVSSIITPYNSGFKGWSPMLQWMFNF
jgi:hypothetical protein